MTELEANERAARLTRIWMPEGSYGEGATWQLVNGELEYTARITDELEMHFGKNELYAGVGFLLRRLNDGRTLWALFCAHDGREVENLMPLAGQSPQEIERILAFYMRLMRSYCWLSGCPLECSEEERTVWTEWLHRREESGRGEPTHTVEWEVKRIATAFDVAEVKVVRNIGAVHYEGVSGGVPITWVLGDPNAQLQNVYAGERSYCGVYFEDGEWEFESGLEGHHEMARGLYRLGIDEEEVWDNLPTLTAHEQLELRLTFPREFWPGQWLDEEKREREAQAWRARLTRVWGAPVEGWWQNPEEDTWRFRTTLVGSSGRAMLRYYVTRGEPEPELEDEKDYMELSYGKGEVHARITDFSREEDFASQQRLAQFTADWMPSFRRGCWLCGCDIEATAHEKAEWMQGFTAEELEAWNLKI